MRLQIFLLWGSLLACLSCGPGPDQQLSTILAHTALPAIQSGVQDPEGMVWVPPGVVDLGSPDGLPSEMPVKRNEVAGFFMDIHPVTVAQFRRFVEATGYVTTAEKFGDSGVFDFRSARWTLVAGANWHHPFGPARPPAPDDHPVTQVSWEDAIAYATWAGKRLPKEVEWEHAARNAINSPDRYPWGNDIRQGKTFLANFWQGNFPYHNSNQDGYPATSPVGAFGKTPLGLTDMAGNVWEWCQEEFVSYDPEGPVLRQQPNQPEKVMRGGSFLCDPQVCHGFRVSGRSGTSPETGLCHLGFRCVKDAAR